MVSLIDPKTCLYLENELREEVDQGHILFHRSARAIAHRRDRDDVLFEVDSPAQFALVHLTYTSPERPPFPMTVLFESLVEFIEFV